MYGKRNPLLAVAAIATMLLFADCGKKARAVVYETTDVIESPEEAHPRAIAKVRPGDVVEILSEKKFDGTMMYKVSLKGDKTGWIDAKSASKSEKKGDLVVDGFALAPVNVLDDPSAKAPKILASLKRGETFHVIREKKFGDRTFLQAGISGIDTICWVDNDFIFVGNKTLATATDHTDIYDRPEKTRKTEAKVPQGKLGYILEKDGDFVKFNTWKGQNYWVLKSDLIDGKVKIRQSVNIQGFGKALLDASSWVYDDVEGQETVYSPMKAFDGSFGTSWQTNKSGGVGEWISVEMEQQSSFQISLVNGFAKTEELYKQNNRVTSVRVSCFNAMGPDGPYSEGSPQEITLDGSIMDYQGAGSCQSSFGFKLEITGVAEGSQWHDAAISEIKLDPGP